MSQQTSRRKKHLKYRVSKHGLPTVPSEATEGRAVKSRDVLSTKQAHTTSSKQASTRSLEPITALEPAQTQAVRDELWQVVRVALLLALLYTAIWLGFHYLHWDRWLYHIFAFDRS